MKRKFDYYLLVYLKKPLKDLFKRTLFSICSVFPLQNKIIASTFKGTKYGDNPQFIFEELRKLDNTVDFVWMKKDDCTFEIPSWVRQISWTLTIKTIYELSTAKVIIDTHRFRKNIIKRKGQLFIETWHGGLGIKKIETDVPKFCNDKLVTDEIETTNRVADVFISQSDHLSNIYRRAFKYKGPIWKCGYPKNDVFFSDNSQISLKVRNTYNIKDKHIILYAPSFRDNFYEEIDISVYSVDFEKLQQSLTQRFGGEWVVMTRWHPLFATQISNKMNISSNVIDATKYPDIQDLLMTVDVLISDYSSCMFDAALRKIPCFIYATDVEEYSSDRGLYYQMEELPFPFASNNNELVKNVLNFNEQDYHVRLKRFFERVGLVETGHAGEDIARKIYCFIKGEKVEWR